ncbi:hypothetical protein BDL97_02G166000 [Sphagnum fallax]|nr:hypothetical protein BDL97_02G166000 [Sphagnum fallax]
MAATSAKTGERAKYTREKVVDVARGTSGTAKKVTYDATTAKVQELGATASQKAKETVNAAAETGKEAYKAAAQNSKAALDVIMETATKTELVLEQALTTIRAVAELGKKMMNLKLKMMKCKVEETSPDAATKQTKNEAEAAAEQAKKAYELAVEKTREAAEAASGTLLEQTYDDATTGKVYRTSDEACIEKVKAKYAEAKGAASKMAAETGEKLKNLEGEHEEL